MLDKPYNWDDFWGADGTICEYKILADGEEYNSVDDIEDNSLKLLRPVFSRDKVIGNCPCFSLSCCLKDKAVVPSKGSIFILSIRLKNREKYTDWVKLGEYKIYRREHHKDGWTSYVCRDRMQMANQIYEPTIMPEEWPASMKRVLEDSLQSLGLSLDSRSEIQEGEDWVIENPGKISMRAIWSYIATVHGGNFIITPQQTLLLVTPKVSDTYVETEVSDIVLGHNPVYIDRLTFTYDGSEVYSGDSGTNNISLECPYLKDSQVSYAKSKLDGNLYYPMEASEVYFDPLAEIQDTYMVADKETIFSQVETTFGIQPLNRIISVDLIEPSSEYGFEDTVYKTLDRKISNTNGAVRENKKQILILDNGLNQVSEVEYDDAGNPIRALSSAKVFASMQENNGMFKEAFLNIGVSLDNGIMRSFANVVSDVILLDSAVTVNTGALDVDRGIIGHKNIRANEGLSSTKLDLDTTHFSMGGYLYNDTELSVVTSVYVDTSGPGGVAVGELGGVTRYLHVSSTKVHFLTRGGSITP